MEEDNYGKTPTCTPVYSNPVEKYFAEKDTVSLAELEVRNHTDKPLLVAASISKTTGTMYIDIKNVDDRDVVVRSEDYEKVPVSVEEFNKRVGIVVNGFDD